jgi:hypothetical protein
MKTEMQMGTDVTTVRYNQATGNNTPYYKPYYSNYENMDISKTANNA